MHIDNLLFLFLIVIAGLLRLLMSKVNQPRNKSEDPTQEPTTGPAETISRAPADSDEERIRKFLEALGQPTTSKPPPRVMPKPVVQKREATTRHLPPFGSPLPPLTTVPPPLPSEEPLPPRRVFVPKTITPAPAEVAKKRPVVAEEYVFDVREVNVVPPPQAPSRAEASVPLPATATSYEAQDLAPTINRSLRALLTSPQGLRNAMILREIFGPPRSMQPVELV